MKKSLSSSIGRVFFILILLTGVTHVAHAATETVKVYSDGSDWGIQTAPYPSSWDTQYYSTNGIDTTAPADISTAFVGVYNSNQGYLGIHRSFLSFDTSLIPDNAVIDSAVLRIIPDAVIDEYNDQYSYMNVVEGRQASPTSLTLDDIEMCGNTLENSTKGSSDIDISTIVQNAPLTFPFNQAGVSWIKKDGYTKLCVREGHDIENSEAINNDNYWRETGISFHTSESEGTDLDPYLEVTYTVPDHEQTITERMAALISAVKQGGFLKSVEQSYLAQIEKLPQMYGVANTGALINQLNVFILKVEKDAAQGIIGSGVAHDLVTQAEMIIAMLDGGTSFEVPLITQKISPYPSIPETTSWAGETYANGNAYCGITIKQCGCLISSLSMLGNYYGVHTGIDGTAVNPRNMNAWLKAHNGYTVDGGVLWNYALAYMGEKKDGKALSSLMLDATGITSGDIISGELTKQKPVVAFNQPEGHWMVLRGTTGAGYYVNDPFWYKTKTTHDTAIPDYVRNYHDVITKATMITHTGALKPIPKSVELVLESPAELLLTDSEGRRLGYDPSTGGVVAEIPGGSYDQHDAIVDPTGEHVNDHQTKRLMLTESLGDTFELKVIGTGDGVYHLSSAITDGKGGLFGNQVEETTTAGEIDTYTVVTNPGSADLPKYLSDILALIPESEQMKFVQTFWVLVGQTEKDHVVPTRNIIEGLIRYTEAKYTDTTWASAVVAALKLL